MSLKTLRHTKPTMLLILITVSIEGFIHDRFVPDMQNPEHLIHSWSGQRLIPIQGPHGVGQIYVSEKSVSKWEYLRYIGQANKPMSSSISDLNSRNQEEFIGGLIFSEAENYCRFYGLDIPSYQTLKQALKTKAFAAFETNEKVIPDFEWTSDTTTRSSVDHRKVLLTRANLGSDGRSMQSRDKGIGFRCVFKPGGKALTELLLGYKKEFSGTSTMDDSHLLRLETNPAGVEVYEDAHYKHAIGKTPFLKTFKTPRTQLVVKGNSILPQTIQIQTPPGQGQVLRLDLLKKPQLTFIDHNRSSSMNLIPQGKVNIGLSFSEQDQIQNKILTRKANWDLREEQTRLYLKDEGPDRNFLLSNFYMDQTEVTNVQYAQYIKESGKPNSRCSQVQKLSRPKAPVVCVTWLEAQEFCRFYGLTLPSEAQFEKAMQGIRSQDLKKPWHQRPQLAGSQPADRSSFGIYDLGGNVMEWTGDWYDPQLYASGFILNPKPSNLIRQEKTIKGTSFAVHRLDARPSKRRHKRPSHHSIDLGFRCVKNL